MHASDIQEGRGGGAEIARPIDDGRGGDDPAEQRDGDGVPKAATAAQA